MHRKNFLSCNDTKTEFTVIGTRQQLVKVNIHGIQIRGKWIEPMKTVRNSRVMFDSNMNMISHVSSVSQSSFYHLNNLASGRIYLDHTPSELVGHAFITFRLDMGTH